MKLQWRKYTFYVVGGFCLIGVGLFVWRLIEFFNKKREAIDQEVAQLKQENEDFKQAIKDIIEDSVEKHQKIEKLIEENAELTLTIKLMADNLDSAIKEIGEMRKS
jgi:uncharacterized coiled-coil DUF342 family protein